MVEVEIATLVFAPVLIIFVTVIVTLWLWLRAEDAAKRSAREFPEGEIPVMAWCDIGDRRFVKLRGPNGSYRVYYNTMRRDTAYGRGESVVGKWREPMSGRELDAVKAVVVNEFFGFAVEYAIATVKESPGVMGVAHFDGKAVPAVAWVSAQSGHPGTHA